MKAVALSVAIALVVCGCTSRSRTAEPSPGLAMNGTVVRCPEASSCFDNAKALCQGPWHQVAEPGMAFPAIVNDEQGGYRMLVTCDSR